MSLIIFYDTETTNKTDFKASYDAPHQPDLVQLGYKVYDIDSREVVFEIGHLVDTRSFPSFNMSAEAQAVHGISPALLDHGWTPNDSISLFQRWLNRSSIRVAHNEQFDSRVMQCFSKRAGWSPDIFTTNKPFCTMQNTTSICKIPGKYGVKWPTLAEAYAFFMDGASFGGAHNALVDVNACADIFWKLIDLNHFYIHQNNVIPSTIRLSDV